MTARELAREKIGARRVAQAEIDKANTADLAYYFQLTPRIDDHRAAIEELALQQAARLKAIRDRGHTIGDIAEDTGLTAAEVRQLIKLAATASADVPPATEPQTASS